MRSGQTTKGDTQVFRQTMCRFVVKADHLEDLVHLGTLTRPAARFLEASVVAVSVTRSGRMSPSASDLPTLFRSV